MEGVVYEIECQVCKENGVRRVYLGETGRSVYERMLNHWDDWDKKKEGSSLWKHSVNEHGGLLDDDKFYVKVLRRPRTALERQVLEGVLIEEEKLGELLNSKSE